MVNDAIVTTAEPLAVHRLVRNIADAESNVADDDIMRAVSAAGKIREADAVARRCLSRNRAIRIMHRARRFQPDDAGDAENNCARSFGFDGGAETSRAAVVQIGDFDDAATATADSKTSV